MFCTNCGALRGDERSRFCTECGVQHPGAARVSLEKGDHGAPVTQSATGWPAGPPPGATSDTTRGTAQGHSGHAASPEDVTLPRLPTPLSTPPSTPPSTPLPPTRSEERTLPAAPWAASAAPVPPAPFRPAATPPAPVYPIAPGPVPPPVPGGPRRRSGVPLLVVLVVLGALAAAVAGALVTVALVNDGEDDAALDAAAVTPSADGASNAVEPGASGASDADGPADAAFRCWDGTTAASLDACGDPTGTEGLGWVFPQSTDPGCQPSGGGTRVAEADCLVRASSGGAVRVHYTEWADRDAAYGEYSSQNVQGAVTRWREFFRWYITPLRGDWDHKVALLYREAPWSVTVYGHTAADRDEVLRDLVTRPVSDLMGERAD